MNVLIDNTISYVYACTYLVVCSYPKRVNNCKCWMLVPSLVFFVDATFICTIQFASVGLAPIILVLEYNYCVYMEIIAVLYVSCLNH